MRHLWIGMVVLGLLPAAALAGDRGDRHWHRDHDRGSKWNVSIGFGAHSGGWYDRSYSSVHIGYGRGWRGHGYYGSHWYRHSPTVVIRPRAYCPPPVVVYQPPVYVAPRPVYVYPSPPVVYRPAPVVEVPAYPYEAPQYQAPQYQAPSYYRQETTTYTVPASPYQHSAPPVYPYKSSSAGSGTVYATPQQRVDYRD